MPFIMQKYILSGVFKLSDDQYVNRPVDNYCQSFAFITLTNFLRFVVVSLKPEIGC